MLPVIVLVVWCVTLWVAALIGLVLVGVLFVLLFRLFCVFVLILEFCCFVV